jgi:predicted type IV restriction endonuclease
MSMPLEPILTDVIAKLKQGKFANEQAISQGIVLRILQALDWDTFDTSLVSPEFRTAEGRADFALCHPPTKPILYIEVKPPGKAEDSVRQALGYAFQYGGVPMVILTDGKTWSFYLTMEQGSYEERRVYKLDLFERDTGDAVEKFTQYLSRSKVISGEALDAARQEYRSKNRRAQAIAAIPSAWVELIQKGDELLVELIGDAVESKCGVRPEDGDILSFLRNAPVTSTVVGVFQGTSTARSEVTSPVVPFRDEPRVSAPRAGMIRFKGNDIRIRNALEATLLILRKLAESDPSFLSRCAAHPDNFGRKRAYIAKTTEELFPDRPDLRSKHETIADGWLLNTNVNNGIKEQVVKLACDVASLKFGTDVQIDF